MKDQFIPYELAVKLKELGFNEECIATFDEDENFELQDFEQNYDTFPSHIIAAPLWQQAFDWFRDKYGLHIWFPYSEYQSVFYSYVVKRQGGESYSEKNFKTSKEAIEACLIKLIELCESNWTV